ncbi:MULTISPECIES: hypothetical protein [Microbacterium]|uniref:hypothetical protein n=1 Tax=Microbacterium TaxID=33882 RepID=UPI002786FFD8|nr:MULTISPECIES: hypothetical protein [Microbacterium]MDQ1083002.1 hypothetical protein [Microbacterium sp. SORGH_AS_0344]MDQ1168231.1 hypothetical protein [Microbacterium proteolyticum]
MNITPIRLPSDPADDGDDVDDIAGGFAPHCPGCLRTCDPWEAGRSAAWRCPDCELVLIG